MIHYKTSHYPRLSLAQYSPTEQNYSLKPPFVHSFIHFVHSCHCYIFQDNADPAVCKQVLKQDDYVSVHNLVLYYQMVSTYYVKIL